jgi:hypothetical protein
MELITRPPRQYHVSHDTAAELERTILEDPRVVPAQSGGVAGAIVDVASRTLRKAGTDIGSLLRVGNRSGGGSAMKRDYLAVMMELDAARTAPWFIRSGRRSVYLFDAWPARHGEIRSFVEAWGIQYAFISSSQGAERLTKLTDRCTFMWVPEGVEPSRYQQRSFIEKDIDVLQLGRKYDSYHARIVKPLESAAMSYFYEKETGGIIFPTRLKFVEGLARAKISICFPSSLTHPQRAADLETMTTRYLQSMVSKCLVLGHAPREMVELFGYNPVVEVDDSDPAGQILEILRDYESYLPLIEKNFDTVRSDHTWARRWNRMAEVLFV